MVIIVNEWWRRIILNETLLAPQLLRAHLLDVAVDGCVRGCTSGNAPGCEFKKAMTLDRSIFYSSDGGANACYSGPPATSQTPPWHCVGTCRWCMPLMEWWSTHMTGSATKDDGDAIA